MSKVGISSIPGQSIKLPLFTALHRAKRDRQPVLYTGIKVNRAGEEINVSLRVGSQAKNSTLEDYLHK